MPKEEEKKRKKNRMKIKGEVDFSQWTFGISIYISPWSRFYVITTLCFFLIISE